VTSFGIRAAAAPQRAGRQSKKTIRMQSFTNTLFDVLSCCNARCLKYSVLLLAQTSSVCPIIDDEPIAPSPVEVLGLLC
jgi:hypothetical protein